MYQIWYQKHMWTFLDLISRFCLVMLKWHISALYATLCSCSVVFIRQLLHSCASLLLYVIHYLRLILSSNLKLILKLVMLISSLRVFTSAFKSFNTSRAHQGRFPPPQASYPFKQRLFFQNCILFVFFWPQNISRTTLVLFHPKVCGLPSFHHDENSPNACPASAFTLH